MFDHLGLVFRDLGQARAFYEPLLSTLGVRLIEDHTQGDGTGWLVFSSGAPESPFFVVAAGRPTYWRQGHEPSRSPPHIAFTAPDRAAVDAFHARGVELGGQDNGGPGVRRGRYYCAFLIDLDGNNIEAGVYADA
jgi:catechol 2,3-dioxygenase-like lactoylglutathione lyase family enzyme